MLEQTETQNDNDNTKTKDKGVRDRKKEYRSGKAQKEDTHTQRRDE